MKKQTLLILTAVVAVSCTKGYFPENENSYGDAISFAGKSESVTKAGGGNAATALGGKFTVYGAKSIGNDTSMVFDDYTVKWSESSQAWYYVDQQDNGKPVQTIKYWDNKTSQYDFVAFSQGGGYATFSDVNMSNIGTDNPIYTISGTPDDNHLFPIYLADIATVKKENYGTGPVSLKFRPFRTKIRFGIYETVPGYSVTDVQFYKTVDPDYPGITPTIIPYGNVFPSTGTFEYSVYASADYRLSAQYATTSSSSFVGNKAFAKLNYSDNHVIGTSSANASYFIDQFDNEYIDVLPIGDSCKAISIRVDFTLTPLDPSDQHSITVKDVAAVIPAEYVKWQPGSAYTYLFKISETSGGLYPITFDAEQFLDTDPLDTETTEIDIPITAYQKGTALETQGAFSPNDSIYITVGDYCQLQKSFFDTQNYIRLYRAEGTQTITEANVQNCIDNGAVKGRPNVYSVTDALGKTLKLTDITKDSIKIQNNFGAGDMPSSDFEDKTNAIACTPKLGPGTYVFTYVPNAPTDASYNTLAKDSDYYEYEFTDSEEGYLYYIEHFNSDGTEQYNNTVSIVKDLMLLPENCLSSDNYDGSNRSTSTVLLDGMTYYKEETVDGAVGLFEFVPTTMVSVYNPYYRLKSAVYFDSYKPGYTIMQGEKYWKVVKNASDQIGYVEGTEYPVVITENNKNNYVCAKIYGTKINEYPFERVTSSNNYTLKNGKWYLAVDGFDKFRDDYDYNDDGSLFDLGSYIYIEEYMAGPTETAQMCIWNRLAEIDMKKTNGISFEYGLFYDWVQELSPGLYYELLYSNTLRADGYNTLAPGNYKCHSNADGIVHRFTALGNEDPDFIEKKYGSGNGDGVDCKVYLDNDEYKSYIKIIEVR